MQRSWAVLVIAMAAMVSPALVGQEEQAEPQEKQSEAKKPAYVPPSARLVAAKSALVTNGGGSEIPYNVISSGLEGWGRFKLVDKAPEADIIVEVSSPAESGGVSVSSQTQSATGRPEQTTTTSRNLSGGTVKLVVYDAKTKVALWSATEQAKSALRQKAREDNLYQAAARLMTKFRERVEGAK